MAKTRSQTLHTQAGVDCDVRVAGPDLAGAKPTLLAKLREQQLDLEAGSKEVREAVNALEAESEAKAAAAAAESPATNNVSALSHAELLRANSSQSAPWIPPGLKLLPYAALHQWVHEHDEVAGVSEVPPTPADSLMWAQFPDSSSSPTEDGDWLQTPTPLCISRE
jgi:hypothetical protein